MERYLSNLISLPSPIWLTHYQEITKFLDENNIQDSVIVCSSQTTSVDLKFFIIKISSMTAHARNINNSFHCHSESKWFRVLPLTFMGGLSIYFRQQVSQCFLEELDQWNLHDFEKRIFDYRPSHLSLVPTQLFDIIQNKMKIPSSLKYIFIGGDKLDADFQEQCLSLELPIYLTYGMSEFCSQIATSKLINPMQPLKILPWYDYKIIDDLLYLKSDFHFDFKIEMKNNKLISTSFADLTDHEGFLPTNDRVHLLKNHLSFIGRNDSYIKSKGKFKDLQMIEQNIFQSSLGYNQSNAFVFSSHDKRSGHIPALATTYSIEENSLFFNQIREIGIKKIFILQSLPLTNSFKIKKNLDQVSSSQIQKEILL